MAYAARLRRPDRFEREVRLFGRWARRCRAQDRVEIQSLVGLSPDGSPPTHMKVLYEQDPTPDPYADDYRPEPPDPEVLEVEEFMVWCEVLFPQPYKAVLARHCRLINGVRAGDLGEGLKAQRLYGLPREQAHHQLKLDCEIAYAALSRWLAAWRRREGLDL